VSSPAAVRWGVWRWIRRTVAGLLAVVLVVVGLTAFRVWEVARTDARPRSDAIVVLGASQFDGRPSEVFRARLLHAKVLYDDKVATRIVTVGAGLPADRFTEAAAGARWLADHGVLASSLVPVGQGRDTLESLRAAARTFGDHDWRSAVIVTDPWHSLRARRMAQDLGIAAATSPVRTGPAVHTRSTEARYIARETVAYLYYRMFHRSSAKGPGAV
jgi:uncharacterized SAM-binding protein YcdF (DUF218 family)